MSKVKRNDLCPCVSGLKYKKCHYIKQWEEKKEKEIKFLENLDKPRKMSDKTREALVSLMVLGQHRD